MMRAIFPGEIHLILGAPDPEMAQIQELAVLTYCTAHYALTPDRRRRVSGAEAYHVLAMEPRLPASAHLPPHAMAHLFAVECDGPAVPLQAVRLDHHRPGDAGYGRPPSEFLAASSLGQLIGWLARLGPLDWPTIAVPRNVVAGEFWYDGISSWAVWTEPGVGLVVPSEMVLTAAADHCLAAAYRGACPGVQPEELMRWRAACRAKFQGRPIEAVLADIEAARTAIRSAPVIELGSGETAYDLRGQHIPELPEAAAREGVCVLAEAQSPDGRRKIVCQSGTPEQIRAFLDQWAVAEDLVDLYGDPARGFAGGYV